MAACTTPAVVDGGRGEAVHRDVGDGDPGVGDGAGALLGHQPGVGVEGDLVAQLDRVGHQLLQVLAQQGLAADEVHRRRTDPVGQPVQGLDPDLAGQIGGLVLPDVAVQAGQEAAVGFQETASRAGRLAG